MKIPFSVVLLIGCVVTCRAEDPPEQAPAELEELQSCVGVWDAEIEVWPAGPDSPSTRFSGVETNTAYGRYWIASDFDSEFAGETMKIHSIIGYDLDQKRMVGTVIDHGPYSASMTGDYDKATKTVTWMTKAKGPDGEPMVQKTVTRQIDADTRLLILSVPGQKKGEFTKFMQITFVRRK